MNETARSEFRGFTLIELLVAIAIMAVVAVLSYRGLSEVIRGRDRIMASLIAERDESSLFEQVQADARAAPPATVDVPPVVISGEELRLLRTVRLAGQAPRLQIIRYRREGQAVVRDASPLLSQRSELTAQLAPSADRSAWQTTRFDASAQAVSYRAFVRGIGWLSNPDAAQTMTSAAAQAVEQATAAAAAATPVSTGVPEPIFVRRVVGLEISVSQADSHHPLTRRMLVGQ